MELPPIVGRLVGDTSDFATKMGGAKKVAIGAATGIAAAGVAAGAMLTKVGSDFDSAFDTIRVGTGATGAALRGLEGDFKAVVKDVPTDFGAAADAIADLNTRTGQTGPGLQALSKQFLEMSRLTGTDLKGNIAAVTRVFGDWGIATEDQAGTLDKLFRASQATGAGVDQLASQVVQFGAPLRQMGFSFEQSIAMLGKFEKEGVNTELVMGSLRIALGKLAKDGREPVQAFREQVDAIKAAADAGEANALAFELFGARAGPDMAAAIREGRFELNDLFEQISSGSETIMSASKDTEDFGEKWTKLKNRVFVAVEPVASKLFDSIGKGMDRLSEALPGVVDKLEEWKGPLTVVAGIISSVLIPAVITWGIQSTIAAGKSVLAFVMTQAAAVGAAIATVAHIGMMVAGWVLLGTQALLHAAKVALAWMIAMGPIGLVIAAIVGLVALIIIHFDTIKNAIGAAWEWIKGVTGSAWDWIKGVWSGALEWVKGVLSGALDTVKGIWNSAWETIKGALSDAWEWIKRTVSDKIEDVTAFMRELPGKIVGALGDLSNLLRSAGRQIIRGLIGGMEDETPSLWGLLRNIATQIVFRKGPPERDRRLLVPAGQAIMQGLVAGLESERQRLYDSLAHTTGMIQLSASPAVGLSGALSGGSSHGGGVVINVHVENHGSVVTERQLVDAVAEGLRAKSYTTGDFRFAS